jgi:hypothetical protein
LSEAPGPRRPQGFPIGIKLRKGYPYPVGASEGGARRWGGPLWLPVVAYLLVHRGCRRMRIMTPSAGDHKGPLPTSTAAPAPTGTTRVHVVRIAAQVIALLKRPWCSDRRQRQGHNCEEPESNGYDGYTSFRHSGCRWRYSTWRAIYYRESICCWYVKDSLLYSPFQFVFNERVVFHWAQWISSAAFVLVLASG